MTKPRDCKAPTRCDIVPDKTSPNYWWCKTCKRQLREWYGYDTAS